VRKTLVLLLNVPEWAETEDVVGGLAKVGVTVVTSDGNLSFRKNGGNHGDHVAKLDLPYQDAIKLAEAKSVVVGWTRCRVMLLEPKQPTCFRCHNAAECRNEAKPRACFR